MVCTYIAHILLYELRRFLVHHNIILHYGDSVFVVYEVRYRRRNTRASAKKQNENNNKNNKLQIKKKKITK